MEKNDIKRSPTFADIHATLNLANYCIGVNNSFLKNSFIKSAKYEEGEGTTVTFELGETYKNTITLCASDFYSIKLTHQLENGEQTTIDNYELYYFMIDENNKRVYICMKNGQIYKYFVGIDKDFFTALCSGLTEIEPKNFVLSYKKNS